MLLKVCKVLWFMFARQFAYGWLRLVRSPRLQARLAIDYRNWANYTLGVFGVDLTVRGREHIPAGSDRRLVIMSNHQSQLDIPAIAGALDRLCGFVAKRELTRIPLLSYWMRQIGCVTIDRADKRGAHKALEKAAGEMTHPLAVFPEGTRSKDGSLLPFKLGGSRLAVLSQAIILPVLIEGTRDAAENRKPGSSGKRIPVRVTLFPALDTRGMDESKPNLNAIKDYVERCWRNPSAPT